MLRRHQIHSRFKTLIGTALLATGLFLGVMPGVAQAKKNLGEAKRLILWDRPVHYQFLLKQDASLPFDGEAYAKEISGERVFFVVLNPVYFSREAKELFARLQNQSSSEKLDPTSLQEGMSVLASVLAQRPTAPQGVPQADAPSLESLKALQVGLENLAWQKTFAACYQESPSTQRAQQCFMEHFTQTRMTTIEYHEVAHLLDMTQNHGPYSEAFTRTSELNAFYTELAYGKNPLDTLAQALTGLIDELQQSKYVDYSLDKIAMIHHSAGWSDRLAQKDHGPLRELGRKLYSQAQAQTPTQVAQAGL